MARHGGGSFDATTKVNDALKLKIADGEVLISIDTDCRSSSEGSRVVCPA